MDKQIASIHGLDANAKPSKEKWLTQCGEFKTTARLTLDNMKLQQFTTKRTVTKLCAKNIIRLSEKG